MKTTRFRALKGTLLFLLIIGMARPANATSGALCQTLFGTGTSNSQHGLFVASSVPDTSELVLSGKQGNEYFVNGFRASYDWLVSVSINRYKTSGGVYTESYAFQHATSSGINYQDLTSLGLSVGTTIGFCVDRSSGSYSGKSFDFGIRGGSASSPWFYVDTDTFDTLTSNTDGINAVQAVVWSDDGCYSETPPSYTAHRFYGARDRNNATGTWDAFPSSVDSTQNDASYLIYGTASGTLASLADLYLGTYH